MSKQIKASYEASTSDISTGDSPSVSNLDIANQAKKLVRIGWSICGGGLVVALLGARLIVSGGKLATAFAQGTHSTGMFIMLVGFVTTLVGYRLPWLVKLQARWESSAGEKQVADASVAADTRMDGPTELDIVERIQRLHLSRHNRRSRH